MRKRVCAVDGIDNLQLKTILASLTKKSTVCFENIDTGVEGIYILDGPPDELFEAETELDPEKGGYLIIDGGALKNPIYAPIMNIEESSIGDLVEQIQGIFIGLSDAEDGPIDQSIDLEDVMITKLVICTSGDVVAYVKNSGHSD